jgi:hypothetical protein
MRVSTGPGRLKEMVNGPAAHSCWTFIWYTVDEFVTSPVSVMTPSI